MNLASALTDGFANDIGIDQATINLGNQLMFMGIVVLEIPCNMLLQRVSPRHSLVTARITEAEEANVPLLVRSPQVDIRPNSRLRHSSHDASLRQEPNRLPHLAAHTRLRGSGVHTRRGLYPLNVVQEARARKARGGLLLRNVRWERHQPYSRVGDTAAWWEEGDQGVAVAIHE